MARLMTSTAALVVAAGMTLSVAPVTLAQQAALGAMAPAAEDAAELLPLKNIILYRSGVGYFERRGTIAGEHRIALSFETEQINDILKSLVLLDLDGGSIDAVSYASKEPLNRRLAGFGIDISNVSSVVDLMRQLRGQGVDLTTREGQVHGTVLGIEERTSVVTGGDTPITLREPYLVVTTQRGVEAVAISAINSFQIADDALAEELDRALGALAEAKADRTKTVEMSLRGEGGKQRRIVAAYVHEMPVWKTSYRLVLPDEQGGAPTLQGWAIVENTTDSDWNNVRLGLASGRPVGFTMDLYEPVYVGLPDVPVPVDRGVGPLVFESAQAQKMLGRAAAAPATESRLSAADMVAGQRALTMNSNQGWNEVDLNDPNQNFNIGGAAPASAATGAEVGEQFMYTVDAPVTIERQRSAMLPILVAPVEGKRVSIFNPREMSKHPMRGVAFTNTSGLHLLPGPLAVYDGNTYAGDAQIPHTSRNQDRLLAYALDLDMFMYQEVKYDQTTMRFTIADGLVRKQVKHVRSTEYKWNNYDDSRDRTLIIEHPRTAGWELVKPEKPRATTENLWRFETKAEGGKTGVTFDVDEQQVLFESIAMVSVDLPELLAAAANGKVSQAVIDAVRKAQGMQSEVRTIERQLQVVQKERDGIFDDQRRIRDNMGRVDRNSNLFQTYMTKLAAQETRLEEIEQEVTRLVAARDAAQGRLNEFLNGLDVE